jgi:hypothetical protein
MIKILFPECQRELFEKLKIKHEKGLCFKKEIIEAIIVN